MFVSYMQAMRVRECVSYSRVLHVSQQAMRHGATGGGLLGPWGAAGGGVVCIPSRT